LKELLFYNWRTAQQPAFCGHYTGQPALTGTFSFTACMPLLAATSAFGLGQCYLHCLNTLEKLLIIERSITLFECDCVVDLKRLCACVRAMQTQLAQQHDVIRELEEKINVTTLEMVKVYRTEILANIVNF